MKLTFLTTLLLPLTILASPLASQDDISSSLTAQSGTCTIKDPPRRSAIICGRTPSDRSEIVYKFTGRSIPVECYSPAQRGGSSGVFSSVYFRVASPNGPCYIADTDMDQSTLCKVKIGQVVC